MRVFIAAQSKEAVAAVTSAFRKISLKHFSGMLYTVCAVLPSNPLILNHSSLDNRTASPRPFLAYYPALVTRSSIKETINFVDKSTEIRSFDTGHPPKFGSLGPRRSFDAQVERAFDGPSIQI
jgi:hypothetical protein